MRECESACNCLKLKIKYMKIDSIKLDWVNRLLVGFRESNPLIYNYHKWHPTVWFRETVLKNRIMRTSILQTCQIGMWELDSISFRKENLCSHCFFLWFNSTINFFKLFFLLKFRVKNKNGCAVNSRKSSDWYVCECAFLWFQKQLPP